MTDSHAGRAPPRWFPDSGIWDCAGSPVAAPATSSVFQPTRASSRTLWLPRCETAADLLRIRPHLSDIGLVRHWVQRPHSAGPAARKARSLAKDHAGRNQATIDQETPAPHTRSARA